MAFKDTGLSAESELLLCCARTHVDVEQAERIRSLIGAGIDWASLIRLAARHATMPLLYWNLNAVCPTAVPHIVLDLLRRSFELNALKNQFFAKELVRLLHLFEEHGVPAFPYKGPFLAVAAYGNLSLRQFGDLDIVVRKQDSARARDLLIGQGYELQVPSNKPDYFKDRYDYHLRGKDGRVNVEIHWSFTRTYWPFPYAIERLWKHLTPVSFAGATILSPPTEDLLLILCAHGAKHCWERLAWIADVAELLRSRRTIDWELLLDHAAQLRSERIVLVGLALATDLLGGALPPQILKRVQDDPVMEGLRLQARGLIFSDVKGPRDEFKRHFFYLRLREHWRDRVPYVIHYLRRYPLKLVKPSARDHAVLRLPTSLRFLYSLVRPIRLIWDYWLSPLRRRLLSFASRAPHVQNASWFCRRIVGKAKRVVVLDLRSKS